MLESKFRLYTGDYLVVIEVAIYSILAFTTFFFAGLMVLTLGSMHNFPLNTVTH